MTARPDSLIRMANQIAANFTNLAPDAAAASVATHIRSFWAPPMRRELTNWIDEGAEGVDPVAILAMEQLRPRPSE
jgi:formate dehydrogenase subunit delta